MSKNAIILGLGVSGVAAARLLLQQGSRVTVVDASDAASLSDRADALQSLGARVLPEVKALPEACYDLCVLSPGIDQSDPWVQEMEDRGVEVISELELGYRHCACPIIAVTGTNGKSTLVKLLHEMLTAGGRRSAIGGNYGIPLSEVALRSGELDWIVVEVSSFQLERVSSFRPEIGVLLNIQPDHLDRHGTMQAYRELKSRLFNRMGPEDVGIVYESEFAAIRALVKSDNRWVTFGQEPGADVRYAASHGVAYTDARGAQVSVSVSDTPFDNPVLGLAAAAAVAVAQAAGLEPVAVAEAMRRFSPLRHRMETVRVVAGVSFVDDSKATNLAALKAGVEMSGSRIHLIAGGQLKEKQLKFVKEVLAMNVACVYVIGDAADMMMLAWQDAVTCVICVDLETAVGEAWKRATSGETVLLSPGCASFDQFKSYKDRGEQFKRIVEDINEERRHEDIISG
ncbi:MAG: UDP-N-acetylmuramoyl-L-alanine--D-glutamate ligase [Verrucomicrobia bacterium]|nr:UDP-N-acetylmuramoyl-L-alanine--D-glutamate ligase [Verrucomicrobiota bacterium]